MLTLSINSPVKDTAKQESGFTLIEVMLAITIFSFLSIASYKLIRSQIFVLEKIEDSIKLTGNLSDALNTINQDFNQILSRPTRNMNGIQHSIEGKRDSIVFTREGWTNFTGEKRSGLQRVRYSFDDEELTFSRERLNNINSSDSIFIQKTSLLSNIKAISFLYKDWDDNIYLEWPIEEPLKDKGSTVQKSIGINEAYALPKSILMSIETNDNGSWDQTFILTQSPKNKDQENYNDEPKDNLLDDDADLEFSPESAP